MAPIHHHFELHRLARDDGASSASGSWPGSSPPSGSASSTASSSVHDRATSSPARRSGWTRLVPVQLRRAPRRRRPGGRLRSPRSGRSDGVAPARHRRRALRRSALVMVGLGVRAVISIEQYGSPWAILLREFLWMVVGGLRVLVPRCRFDYRPLAPPPPAAPHRHLRAALPRARAGHRGELVRAPAAGSGFGQFRLQPSELMKLALCSSAPTSSFGARSAGRATGRSSGPLAARDRGRRRADPAAARHGHALVVGCIAIALLFGVGGVAAADRQGARAARRSLAALVAAGRPVPPGPAPLVPRPDRARRRARATRSSSR